MIIKRKITRVFAVALLMGVPIVCRAQQPVPTPSPQPTPPRNEEQESVKVFTEEILIPVVAYDQYGHFDPTLEPADILVLEDDVPQLVRSVRHLPANILLVVDMGSQIGETGSTQATRRIAQRIIARLGAADQVAIIQNSNRIELLEDWTTDKNKLAHVFDPQSKFFTSRRSRLSECLIAAANKLKEQAIGDTSGRDGWSACTGNIDGGGEQGRR